MLLRYLPKNIWISPPCRILNLSKLCWHWFLIIYVFNALIQQEIFIPLIFVANLATIRYTSQTDPIPPISSDQLQSYPITHFASRLPYIYPYPFAFTPNTSDLTSIVSQVASALNISADPNIVGYASESDILDDVVNGTANISLAIIFNEDFPSNLTYKIRLPYYSSLLDYGDFASRDSKYKVACLSNLTQCKT